MVLYLGTLEAATSYVVRQLPQEENNTNDDYDPFSDSSSSDYDPLATTSLPASKTSKPASTIRPAKPIDPIDIVPNVGFGIDVASGKPSIGFKIGGGSRVGLGYNVAAKKVGMQLWV